MVGASKIPFLSWQVEVLAQVFLSGIWRRFCFQHCVHTRYEAQSQGFQDQMVWALNSLNSFQHGPLSEMFETLHFAMVILISLIFSC